MNLEDIKALAETLKIASELSVSKPNEWLPVYAALGGAIAGAIATFFPTFLLERYRERKVSKRLLNSMLAEVFALVQVIEHRGYLTSIRGIIAELERDVEGAIRIFFADIPAHYSRIYQENCGAIGSIPQRYAEEIVMFHQIIDATVQDIKIDGRLSRNPTIDSYIEVEKMVVKALDIANSLLNKHNEPLKPGLSEGASALRARTP